MRLTDFAMAIANLFKRASAPDPVQRPVDIDAAPQSGGPPEWLTLCQPLTVASEGCALVAYPDPASGGDPWACGYGATGPDVTRGTVWTQEQASIRLGVDLARFGVIVDALVTVPLTAGQKAALVDFTFNVGQGNFADSTLLKMLNRGSYGIAADQFSVWQFAAGKVMPGLVTRRARERSLFLTGAWQ